MSNLDKASILIEALPYIKKYNNKTVVVKYGGSAMINHELKTEVMKDIVLLSLVGINVVLVHGGGADINGLLEKMGKQPRFINGLRYTDKETMDIVQMVLCGKVNKQLTQLLNSHGGKAIGLCGLDGAMIKAKKVQGDQDMGYVGEITDIDVTTISNMLAQKYIPVIASIAYGDDNEVYNINADTAAAKIAAQMGAEKLILMTDIRGLLSDINDESSLIDVVPVSEVLSLKKQGIISGGMIPKVDCCVEAVRRGVKRAHIIDGRIKHSILIEMLSDQGIGTMFL